MTVHVVTTSSNLASVNSSMASGDFMQFTAGTYTLTSPLSLVNGCGYIGNPGAIISAGAAIDLFQIVSGTNSNIYISGLTFDETNFLSPDGVIYIVGNNGAAGSGATYITVSNCTFQNVGGTANCILCYQSDYIRFDNNTFINCYQGYSVHNNDTSNAHGNISISGNTFRGMNRMGIEVQTTNLPYNHLHVNNNVLYDIQNEEAISLVETSRSAVDVVCSNNVIWGCASGIEMGNSNMIVSGNMFTNCAGCLLISSAPNSVISGNVFRNCNAGGIYAQDGGYAENQYIGYNAINGSVVFANSSGTYGNVVTNTSGFVGSSFTIPDYIAQTMPQLDALFASGQAAGTITPQYMRNLFAALANPAYLNSSTYP
jgi:Right handed beta helix region